MLPSVMQVKNFGKRSRTKYTHLLDQDTTVATGGFGGSAPVKAGGKSLEGGGCFTCGGPHLKKGMRPFSVFPLPQNVAELVRRLPTKHRSAHIPRWIGRERSSDRSPKKLGWPPRLWRWHLEGT